VQISRFRLVADKKIPASAYQQLPAGCRSVGSGRCGAHCKHLSSTDSAIGCVQGSGQFVSASWPALWIYCRDVQLYCFPFFKPPHFCCVCKAAGFCTLPNSFSWFGLALIALPASTLA
jgi:hypothetical protein